MSSTFSIEEKIGQMFFIGLSGTRLDDDAVRILTDIKPGGVCLFARNCKKAVEIRTLLDEIREILPAEPFLALDQEGGLVDRLRRVVEPMPSAAATSAGGDSGHVATLADISAEVLRILGFNMNFAPVLDVIDDFRESLNNGLHSRAFGRSADDVVKFGSVYAERLANGGVMGCYKHFPGIGAIEIDSHDDLPSVNLTREDLYSKDLIPYLQLLPATFSHAVMVGHAVFPAFDLQDADSDGRLFPTSLSRGIVTSLLREELNFAGLVLTDDLEMGAIIKHYGMGEAARLAVLAGNDLLLICNDPDLIYEAYGSMLDAVRTGKISEERIDLSVSRIELARNQLSPALNFDQDRIGQLSVEISKLKESLSNGGIHVA